jgi:hypothetical protein
MKKVLILFTFLFAALMYGCGDSGSSSDDGGRQAGNNRPYNVVYRGFDALTMGGISINMETLELMVESGTSITLPSSVLNGFTFVHWTDGTSTYPAGTSYVVEGETTFTAVWSDDAGPYISVYTAEDLNNVRNDLKGRYLLLSDISLADYATHTYDYNIGWEAIGGNPYGDPFSGTFDGNGHEITELETWVYQGSRFYQIGLFGTVYRGTIKNLSVHTSDEGIYAVGDKVVGVVAAALVEGTMDNVHSSGVIDIWGAGYIIGGLVGGVYADTLNSREASIKNSSSTTYIHGDYYAGGSSGSQSAYGGGLVGVASGFGVGELFPEYDKPVIIDNCYASGEVELEVSTGGIAGGIVGNGDYVNVLNSVAMNPKITVSNVMARSVNYIVAQRSGDSVNKVIDSYYLDTMQLVNKSDAVRIPQGTAKTQAELDAWILDRSVFN